MTTKEQVYNLLIHSGSNYISGQDIADKLFVTRASVWKAIKALQKDGYNIEAVTNKGYRMISDSIIPSEHEIRSYIREYAALEGKNDITKKMDSVMLEIHEEIESTNDTAKAYGVTGELLDRIVIADSQTKGRGRRGRDFYSPAGTGLYISFLIFPEIGVEQASVYTCMMAECVCRAINRVTGIDTEIKWVNDIFYNNKKIAGILTEGTTSLEDGSLSYMVIGAGINLYMPYEGFPKDISRSAGALFMETADAEIKNRLYAAIIYEFYRCYMAENIMEFVEDYRKHSMLVGKYVKINTYNNRSKRERGYALVKGIDDECHLIVQYEDGTEEILYGGEVSVVRY